MKSRHVFKMACGFALSVLLAGCGGGETETTTTETTAEETTLAETTAAPSQNKIYYQIKNNVSEKYVSTNGPNDDQPIVQQSEPGDSGLWEIIESNQSGYYQLLNKESQLYLYIPTSDLNTNRAKLQQTTYSSDDNTLWGIPEFGSSSYGRIQNKASGWYMNNISKTSENWPITQGKNPGNGAKWKIVESQ